MKHGRYADLLAFLIIISAFSLAPAGFSSQSSQAAISSNGLVRYSPQPKSGPVFGWGGYITTVGDVIPILDDLKADGYTAIRYWARPYWYYGSSSHNLDFDVLDHLVEEAESRNIVVYIDCEHNYPPSDFIKGHEQDWINDLKIVGHRYSNRSNVVLECINEYTGDEQPALYNRAIADLREDGIHLPLLFNFWWNQKNVALNDPDNNYAIGRHLYGSGYDSYNPSTPMTLEDAVQESGIVNSMHRYFDDPGQTLYLQEAIRLDIPNGWVITELGPTDNEEMVRNPSVGNMAYAMQFLREAASHNVSIICYRIGDMSTKAIYEQKAQECFEEDFFTPPEY